MAPAGTPAPSGIGERTGARVGHAVTLVSVGFAPLFLQPTSSPVISSIKAVGFKLGERAIPIPIIKPELAHTLKIEIV